jgi:hypothetical protein
VYFSTTGVSFIVPSACRTTRRAVAIYFSISSGETVSTEPMLSNP